MNLTLEVMKDLIIRERRKGELLGKCPVCGCNDANFNTEKKTWRCWHCPSTGTIEGGSGTYEFAEQPEKLKNIPALRKLYGELAETYHKKLTPLMVKYLVDRGLTEEIINKFKLGFCPATWIDEYENPFIQESGVLRDDYPVLTNRLVIPYIFNNEVVDLRGRVLNTIFSYKEGVPTYLSLDGGYISRGAVYFFNHDIIMQSDTLILTEGEFKALIGIQSGFNFISTPGITHWVDEWTKLLRDKHIIFMADKEEVVGRFSPSYINAKKLKYKLPNLRIAMMPIDNKTNKVDVDSLVLTKGIKELERAVSGTISVDYYLRIEERKGRGRHK